MAEILRDTWRNVLYRMLWHGVWHADEAAHWPWPCGVLAGYTRTRLTHV